MERDSNGQDVNGDWNGVLSTKRKKVYMIVYRLPEWEIYTTYSLEKCTRSSEGFFRYDTY